ncbi:MAG TPA: ABC transporter permease [bacterium]|nr:ABC transporter permease [bacterium]
MSRAVAVDLRESASSGGTQVRRRLRHWRRRFGLVLGIAVVAAVVGVAVAAPLLSPYGPNEQHLEDSLQAPSLRHFFGTDDLGRDVLTRVFYGGRYTVSVALGVVVLAGAAGVLVGAFSGYLGGWLDEGVMRATELVMAFPPIILAMAIVVALRPGLINAGLAMVLVWWPPYARLARGEVLAVRNLEYIEAAVAAGQTVGGIFRRAILPNILPGLVVFGAVDLGSAIVAAAGLSFLGLGATPPAPEWGAMVSAGRELLPQWWIATFPGLAIFATVVGFNFIGDGIRDLLDPHRYLRS